MKITRHTGFISSLLTGAALRCVKMADEKANEAYLQLEKSLEKYIKAIEKDYHQFNAYDLLELYDTGDEYSQSLNDIKKLVKRHRDWSFADDKSNPYLCTGLGSYNVNVWERFKNAVNNYCDMLENAGIILPTHERKYERQFLLDLMAIGA